MTFDYGLPAELFLAKRKRGARSRLISRRFATAADAIRFAVEDFPAIRALALGCRSEMSASTAKTSIASTRAGFFLYDAEWTKRSSAGGAGQINRESLGPHRDRDVARRATPSHTGHPLCGGR
jgi:hypothetical protein